MFVLSGAIYWMKGEVGSLGCGACRRSVDGTSVRHPVRHSRDTGFLSHHGRRAAAQTGGGVPDSMVTDTDEPVSIRPFDAIIFSLGDLWP